MNSTLRPVPAAPQCLRPTNSDTPMSRRARLAVLSPWTEEHDPAALDLTDSLLAALGDNLNGQAGHYADNGHDEHGRAQVRGDMHARLVYLARIFTSRNPSCQRAADAFLQRAAAARGKCMVDIDPSAVAELEARTGALAKESGEAVDAMCKAMTGKSSEALEHAEQQVIEVLQEATNCLSTLRTLRGRK